MSEKYKTRKEQIKRKKKVRKVSLWCSLFCIVSVIFFNLLIFQTGIIPYKYLIIIWVLQVLNLLPLTVVGVMPKIKTGLKIRQSIICILLSILMISGSILLPTYTGKISKVFVTIPDEGTKNINLYVLNGSDYVFVEDLAGLSVGIQKKLDIESQEFAIKAVNKEIHGKDIDTVLCSNIYDAIDKLYNREIDAILLNEDYINILKKNTDYSDFEDKVSMIYCVPQKEKSDIQLNEVDIVNECFTIAITAVDEWGYDEINSSSGMRSDVNIVAVVNPVKKTACLITIPRDSYLYFKIPESNDIVSDKLTHISIISINKWMEVIEKLLQVDINYYLRVSFSSLVDVVDAIDGIDISNPYEFESKENITYDSVNGARRGDMIIFNEGYIHLCGREALAYCRERDDLAKGDIARNEHQAIVLKSCIDKMCSVQIISKLNKLMKSLEGKFCTNITTEEIYALINMQLCDMADWQIETFSIEGDAAWEYSYMEDDYRSVIEINDEDLREAIRRIESVISM